MFKWLHVSDIHFDPKGDGYSSNAMRDQLSRYVEQFAPFQAFFLTGDLRFGPTQKDGTPGVVEDVVEYIKKIAGAAKLDSENQIYMVPGNHDVSRSDPRSATIEAVVVKYKGIQGMFGDENLQFLLEKFPFYRKCEEALYGRTIIPNDSNPHYISCAPNLNILHVNTAILAHKNGEEGRLLVGLEYLRKRLGEIQEASTNAPIIALGHHGLDMLERDERSKIIRLFEEYKVKLYLCGHCHDTGHRSIDGVHEVNIGCIKQEDTNVHASFSIGCIKDDGIVEIEAHCWDYHTARWGRYSQFSGSTDGKVVFPLCEPVDAQCEPLPIPKRSYKCPDNYIPRTVSRYGDKQDDRVYRAFTKKEEPRTLFEISQSVKHIVLIGEAGSGKTTDLDYLAYQLSSDEGLDLYPLRISLRHFTEDKSIAGHINEEYGCIDGNKLYLLFDAYDEIEAVYKSRFEHQLNDLIEANPQVHVVVTTRGNYYKNAEEALGNEGTFAGFAEYALEPLSEDDIKSYLKSKKVTVWKFNRAIKSKKLGDLLSIPFYLIRIVEIFLSESSLPKRNVLMEKLIEARFNKDSYKYKGSEELDDFENAVDAALQYIAFAMKLLNRNYLESKEYQKLIQSELRKPMKCHGVWKKRIDGTWQFEHNNFLDYLAAKYLSQMNTAEIIKLITTKEGFLGFGWVNTVSYLLEMMPEGNELCSWVIENAPDIVCQFESGILSGEQRDVLFKRIMTNYRDKNLWFPYSWIDIREFSEFFESEAAAEFLLAEIEDPSHDAALLNAINVIDGFKSLFRHDDRARTALIQCCKAQQTRQNERRVAISALGRLGLDSDETNTTLFELYGESQDSYERRGMYTYLIETNQVDQFIDYFIDGTDVFNRRSTDEAYDASEAFRLEEGLMLASTVVAIKKIIGFLTQSEWNSLPYNEEDVIKATMMKAVSFYKNGQEDLFQDVLEMTLVALNRHINEFVEEGWNFFVQTGSKLRAFQEILADEKAWKTLLYDYRRFIDNDCIEYLEALYRKGDQKECFIVVAESLPADHPMHSRCRATVLEVDGITVEPWIMVDCQKIEEHGMQCYFDALFNKAKYLGLVDELAGMTECTDLSFGQLLELPYTKRYELRLVKMNLLRSYRKAPEEASVKERFERTPWDAFSTNAIYEVLTGNEGSRVEISDDQKEYIAQYCHNKVSKMQFLESVTYDEEGNCSITTDVKRALFFIQYFEIPLEREVLYDLLLFPAIYCRDKNNKLTSYGRDEMQFFENRLPKQDLEAQVIYNVQNRQLSEPVLERHLNYCKNNGIVEAVPLATAVCIGQYKDNTKRIAFDYLCECEDEENIFKNVLPYADDTLLVQIAQRLSTSRDNRLVNRLLKRTEELQNPNAFLPYLITLQSKEGLELYYNIAEEKNATPEYSGDDSNREVISSTSATYVIQTIYDVSLVPQLKKIAGLLFRDGFKDDNVSGLYGALFRAFSKIGAANPLEIVKNELIDLMESQTNNVELRGFCYGIIEDIKKQKSIHDMTQWEINSIKKTFEITE